jgi:Peptidase family M28
VLRTLLGGAGCGRYTAKSTDFLMPEVLRLPPRRARRMWDTVEKNLRRHVDALALEIGERNVWRPQALTAAAHYVEHALARGGYSVRRQKYEVAGVPCANLEVECSGAEREGEILLLGAHYDTVVGSPGADDNASGVAALIEIARMLGKRKLRGSVRCVAFVNEEWPFFGRRTMGSLVYARAARARRDDIRLMVSLEMLGYYSAAPGSQRYPPLLRFFYPDRGDFVAFVSNLLSRHALVRFHDAFRSECTFASERLASPAIVPGVSLSDQLSFWRSGYPGIMVTDTAFYRYPHYHRPTDTPDKLDFASMAQVTVGIARAILRLSQEVT